MLNDTIYALPETQEGIALVYNKAVVTEEYLPTDPTNFQDLYDKAAAFQTATGNTLVCNQGFGGSDAYHMAPVYFGFGVPSYVDDEGKAFPEYPRSCGCSHLAAAVAGVSLKEQSYDICNASLQGRQSWHVVDRPVGHRRLDRKRR